ncbi:MAG: hypothetical protein ACO1QR_13980 [Chthoniobacteraceae bacterium]
MTSHLKKEGWSAGAKTAMLVLPVLYVLSIGPVAYWVDGRQVQLSPFAETALLAFYKPLFLSIRLGGLDSPALTYIQWWVDLAKQP